MSAGPEERCRIKRRKPNVKKKPDNEQNRKLWPNEGGEAPVLSGGGGGNGHGVEKRQRRKSAR